MVSLTSNSNWQRSHVTSVEVAAGVAAADMAIESVRARPKLLRVRWLDWGRASDPKKL